MNLKIYYNENYNIDLGFLNLFHPFEGAKFRKVMDRLQGNKYIEVIDPEIPVSEDEINSSVDSLQKLLLKKKYYILRALEVPRIPLLPFSWVDRKILLPMRWAVSGTIRSSFDALSGSSCWNLSGGYHHASRARSEGFCIYNDISIALDILIGKSMILSNDKVLIIDIDAHHGNGNAHVYMDDKSVYLFDIYNNDIYPDNSYTKERLDVSVPLNSGTAGKEYLSRLTSSLEMINGDFKLAFVIAGTDVLESDPLGGLNLSIEECAERDFIVASTLNNLSIPFVFLGGGGYSRDSVAAISEGIKKVCSI